MPDKKKSLLDFWEDQVKKSHTSSNYFFRKSPSHYHMMLLVMSAYKLNKKLSVEELKTKLFSKIIKHVKSKSKFNFNNFNLEITTTCKECN